MDMDFAKMMQMMNAMNGGGNKDMSMLMQLLPTMMNGGAGNNKPAPTQITLNSDEVNKSIFKLYQDEN
ncbi:MAG: hypothetical protein K2I46_01445 [Clostridia bacterium]|nr:hypothetical protein [Clostridia bacterium]MDE6471545.1 hypothetical protein [Clostridia bacterium]